MQSTPENFVTSYEKALATQDWNNVESLIHSNANVSFSNGTVHIGKAKVKIAFEKNFQTIKSEIYTMKNLRWLLKNDTTAVYLFDFHWKGIINDSSAEGHGVGTSVIIKENMNWFLLTEHLSSKPKN